MSFFASLFRKKPLDTRQLPIKTAEMHEESKNIPVLHLKVNRIYMDCIQQSLLCFQLQNDMKCRKLIFQDG